MTGKTINSGPPAGYSKVSLKRNNRPDKTKIRQIYGRRQGHKLSPQQERLMRGLLPEIEVVPPASGQIDPDGLFPDGISELWFEVGFGGGEHLIWQALHHPNAGVIGCEPYLNGVAALLGGIERDKIPNIRIYRGDARDILDLLPGKCLQRAFILFPDPWPKTRHHKRRFVCRENLDRLARVMKSGGELRIASDIADYIYWTLAQIRTHGGFQWSACSPDDWRRRPPDWPQTRYEQKARRAGRMPVFLKFHPVQTED